jgi:hypothetical protein
VNRSFKIGDEVDIYNRYKLVRKEDIHVNLEEYQTPFCTNIKSSLYKALLQDKLYLPKDNTKCVTVEYLRGVAKGEIHSFNKDAKSTVRLSMRLESTFLASFCLARAQTLEINLGFTTCNLPDKRYLIDILYAMYPEFYGFDNDPRAVADRGDEAHDFLQQLMTLIVEDDHRVNITYHITGGVRSHRMYRINGKHISRYDLHGLVQKSLLFLNERDKIQKSVVRYHRIKKASSDAFAHIGLADLTIKDARGIQNFLNLVDYY